MDSFFYGFLAGVFIIAIFSFVLSNTTFISDKWYKFKFKYMDKNAYYYYSYNGIWEDFELKTDTKLYRIAQIGKRKIRLELVSGNKANATEVLTISDFVQSYYPTTKLPKPLGFNKDLQNIVDDN